MPVSLKIQINRPTLVAAIMAIAVGHQTYAADLGQWASYQLSAEQRAWFKQMSDGRGIACCDGADGYPVEYEMHDNKYWVRYKSVWLPVPEDAILRQPNPIGVAVAWFWPFDGEMKVRCFVPGPAP
jgi:hypothetical protein